MKGSRNLDLDRFAAVIISKLGYHVHQHNREQIEQILGRCLERTGCANVDTYIARFEDRRFAQGELREIVLELTVAETYFFRLPEQFQAFVEVALPERLKARASIRRMNILSAGCASGEEPYSLAAAVAGVGDLREWDIQILGIDANPVQLENARKAHYSHWSLRGLSDAQRLRYFQREGNTFVLDAKIQKAVHFELHNLIEDAPLFWRPDFFDIIFCRNVMIYFSPEAVRLVVERLTRSLAPGGFLFLGPSETLRGISREFHLLHTHNAFYYRRRLAHEETTLPPLDVPPAKQPSTEPSANREAIIEGDWVSAIGRASGRIAALAGESQPSAGEDGETYASAREPEPLFPTPQGLSDVHDLLRQERFGDALKVIEGLPKMAINDPDTLLLHAVILAGKGELPLAEKICRQLLEGDELRPGAHYLMAVCRERQGDQLSAAEHDQTSIYLDESFAMPRLHLGLLAKRMGDLSTTRRELGAALSLLAKEDASRILLFGGGFSREALIRFCQIQLDSCSIRQSQDSRDTSKGGDKA